MLTPFMLSIGIVSPAEPAAGVYEDENNVDDQNAQDGMLQPIDNPKQAAEDAEEKSNPFFAADEPEAREDKGCSTPVHAITPLLLFSPRRCISGGGDAFLESQSSGGLGVVHGPWESALQGNPRGTSTVHIDYTGQMSGSQYAKKSCGFKS